VAAIVAIGAFVLLRDTESSELTRGADVAVSCGAGQRAVVRQTVTSGTPHVDIQCVDDAAAQAASYVVDETGRVHRFGAGSEAGGVPTAYAPVAPPAQAPVIPAVYYAAPAPPVQRVAAAPARSPAPTRAVRKQESTWQKRALVIGGSAGAGAGVGALVGGKKGALIGAAIGGGGAALVDALKGD
jgi:hypothetical protein